MNEDFHNGSCCITEECIENIVNAVESVRARNLAARQDNLVGEFVEEARKQGRQLIQEYRYLVETLKDDIIRLFRRWSPSPHRRSGVSACCPSCPSCRANPCAARPSRG